jgi:hypothetical protein
VPSGALDAEAAIVQSARVRDSRKLHPLRASAAEHQCMHRFTRTRLQLVHKHNASCIAENDLRRTWVECSAKKERAARRER